MFVELDRTLESRTERVHQTIELLEPFDAKRFVRRGEYSVLSVEAPLAWLPVACPLRKECYTLVRDEEGVVSMRIACCRRSRVSASTGIAFR